MDDDARIRPYDKNPFYWQYRGRPVLLLGGSREDNLFQIPDIEEHLNLLHSVGGNYVRCTMSSRDPGDAWPFERDPATGLYDLERPGEEYWRRLRRFLDLCLERDIIAQFEMWDRFDFSRDPWQDNPYNPKNNVNYTTDESGLREAYDRHPGARDTAFFRTVPALENNTLLLRFQQQQVEQMLSITLAYPNTLYCMDNETNESPEWPWYWARYIREKARAAGVSVQLTEMWDHHNILADEHRGTFDHPEIFDFCDVSQNNHAPAREHWENPLALRQRFIEAGRRWPMNSVKIYGANSGQYGSTRDAQERFWRSIFCGLASSRFHRPPAGLGLGEIAQAHIGSLRMFTDAMDITACEPHNDLLKNRSWNEAYCTARPGAEYALFFPDGGDVFLDVSAASGRPLRVRWLDIRASRWLPKAGDSTPDEAGALRVATPTEEGYWAALIQAR